MQAHGATTGIGLVPGHGLLALWRCNRRQPRSMHLRHRLKTGRSTQRPRRGTKRHPRSCLSISPCQGFILLHESSNSAPLSTLSPESLLLLLLTHHSYVSQQLRFHRVQVGRMCATGLKAARRGLLCGHTPGIGGSTAGELLSGYTSKGVRGASTAGSGLLCGPSSTGVLWGWV